MKISQAHMFIVVCALVATSCAQAGDVDAPKAEAMPSALPTLTTIPLTETPAPTHAPPTPTPLPATFSEGAEMGKIEEVKRFGLGKIYESAYFADGETIAYGSSFGVYLFSLKKNQIQDFIPCSGEARSIDISPNEKWIAYGTTLGDVVIWDVKEKTQVAALQEHKAAVNNLTFSPDGQFLISSDEAGQLNVFQTSDWALQKTHALRFVYDLAFLPDGSKVLVSAHNRGIVSLDSKGWGILNQYEIVNIQGKNHLLTAENIAIFPGGELMAVAMERIPAIPVIEIASGAIRSLIPIDPAQIGGDAANSAQFDIYALAISMDGNYLGFTGRAGTGLVNLQDSATLIQFLNKGGKISKMEFSPKGDAISMGAVAMNLKKWEFEYPLYSSPNQAVDLLASVNPNDGRKYFKDAALFGSGKWELEIDQDKGDIALKKRGAAQPLFTVNAHTPRPFSAFGQTAYMAKITAAAAADDSFFVTGGADKALKLWTINASPQARLLGMLKNGAKEIAISPNAIRVAVRDAGGILYLFLSTGESQPIHLGTFKQADKIAFSPNSKFLATSVDNEHIIVWDVSNDTPFIAFEAYQSKRLDDQTFTVNLLEFSPDSKVLASGGLGAEIDVWRVSDGNLLTTLDNRTWVTRIQFSEDGTMLYVDGQTDARWWGVKR